MSALVKEISDHADSRFVHHPPGIEHARKARYLLGECLAVSTMFCLTSQPTTRRQLLKNQNHCTPASRCYVIAGTAKRAECTGNKSRF